MFDSFYQLLNSIGYPHPIHPTEVHMPIGLVVGALVFRYSAILFHKPKFIQTAYHCIVLACLFVFPTILFGIMDWQHFYGGAWLLPIKVKLPLAVFLSLLLLTATFIGYRFGTESKSLMIIYPICFVAVVALGYFGGNLVYGSKVSSVHEYKAGEKVFDANCRGCHRNGGNVLVPNLPLATAPELAKESEFLSFIRDPKMPDGSKGMMPPFPSTKISEQEAKDLYEYIVNVIQNKARK